MCVCVHVCVCVQYEVDGKARYEAAPDMEKRLRSMAMERLKMEKVHCTCTCMICMNLHHLIYRIARAVIRVISRAICIFFTRR